MTYRLEDFPLQFDNAKSLATQEKLGNILGPIFLAVVIGMCLLLSGTVVFGHTKGAPVWGIVLGALLPWVLFGGLLALAFSNKTTDTSGLIPAEKSTLVLDDQGVHVRIGQHKRDYDWAGIASAHVIDAHPKGESKVHIRAIHIKMKGQLSSDYFSDLIDSSFGIGVDQLQDLIQQGMQRWGTPIPS
jgi:hypothetical protein